MRKNQKLIIIIISIIVVLMIVGGIFAYLFMKTDLFKSNQELFGKYIAQTVEQFQKITDLQIVEEYKQLRNENKYESKTNIKIVSSEGGEISNPFNKLTAKLNIQKDNENQYLYGDGQILFEDEEYLQAEIIKEKDIYGIRFSDVVKQFVTIKNDEDFETVANSIGVEVSVLEEIINFIDGKIQITSNEQIQGNTSKYQDILMQEIQKGTFTKQKNATITYNNHTTETNAYQVSLSSEQVKNMLIEILNNLKNETELLAKLPIMSKEEVIQLIEEEITELGESEEIPTLIITVFEQKQITLRTIVEVGNYKTTIDHVNENGEIKNIIKFIDSNSDEGTEYNIEIAKNNIENKENFEIEINGLNNGETYTVSFIVQINMSDILNEFEIAINYEQGITLNSIVVANTIDTGTKFERVQVVGTTNNMLLNDLDDAKRQYVINFLNQKVPVIVNERVMQLMEKLGLQNDENQQVTIEEGEHENTEGESSQIEINKFNSKFEFYTGEEVSAENVKKLLDVVKNNVSGHAIMNVGTEEDTKTSITLYIEKDKTNEESITSALELIEENKKYNVSIIYSDTNNLITAIKIVEN